ncbi:MAG: translation initiation factor IF-5A [Candidatus Thermoplasmatota archaeon]|nr:translation initiation factor IF-5A [Candidatus Thermoplasmatota archaeon]
MSWNQAEMRSLKPNRYILIDEEPCKILSVNISKPGKHGEAKARVEAVGIFDKQKRSIVHPVTHKVKVPIIDKRRAQILTVMGSEVQLMDLETYETFNVAISAEMDGKLSPGGEIQYLVAMGRKKITRT